MYKIILDKYVSIWSIKYRRILDKMIFGRFKKKIDCILVIEGMCVCTQGRGILFYFNLILYWVPLSGSEAVSRLAADSYITFPIRNFINAERNFNHKCLSE